MACSTWIYAGSCPYGDRCTFIHDTALYSPNFHARPLKFAMTKPSLLVKDTFYWQAVYVSIYASCSNLFFFFHQARHEQI